MTVDFVEFLTQLRGELERWPRTGEPSQMLSWSCRWCLGGTGPCSFLVLAAGALGSAVMGGGQVPGQPSWSQEVNKGEEVSRETDPPVLTSSLVVTWRLGFWVVRRARTVRLTEYTWSFRPKPVRTEPLRTPSCFLMFAHV